MPGSRAVSSQPWNTDMTRPRWLPRPARTDCFFPLRTHYPGAEWNHDRARQQGRGCESTHPYTHPLRRAGLEQPTASPDAAAPLARPLRRNKPPNPVGRRGRAWRRVREQFLAKRLRVKGFLACEHCGTANGPLDVDHVVKRSQAPERVLDHANLRVLCRRCHLRRHEMARLSGRRSGRGHDAGGKDAANRR